MNLKKLEASFRVISEDGINQILHCQGTNQYGQVMLISVMDPRLDSYRFLNSNIIPQNKNAFIHYRTKISFNTETHISLAAINTGN